MKRQKNSLCQQNNVKRINVRFLNYKFQERILKNRPFKLQKPLCKFRWKNLKN